MPQCDRVRWRASRCEEFPCRDCLSLIVSLPNLGGSVLPAGFKLSLDDFGTGYSSLSYLQNLPLEQVKIDRSSVHDMVGHPKSAAFAHAIIMLAGNIGLEVVAEGVETESQRAQLERVGCRCFQGFLFGRPLPLAAFEAAVFGCAADP